MVNNLVKKFSKEITTEYCVIIIFLVNNEDVQKALDWLKINQAPWEIVLEKWYLTSKYRLQILMKSSDKKLNNIFEEWPLLKHPYGYKLIKHDFDQMHLTNFSLTSKKWNEFFNTIEQNVQLTNKNDDFSDLIQTLNLDISEGKVIYLLYLYIILILLLLYCKQYKCA